MYFHKRSHYQLTGKSIYQRYFIDQDRFVKHIYLTKRAKDSQRLQKAYSELKWGKQYHQVEQYELHFS